MMHIVDIETWERKDNYNFFRNFLNPWISIATEVDCTEARAAAKATGRSFFLYYLYAVVRSANEIREFRYRTDSRGKVVYHDTVDIITPIAVPGRTFFTVRIPYHADFEKFYAEARSIVTDIPADGDPYGVEKILQAQGDYDVVHLSATPNLYFTSVTYAQGAPGCPTEYPLMNAGKAVMREGRLVMPLSIFVSHAFVDGAHIALFFSLIEQHLKRISDNNV
ncbi:CatA-like O-acetyltransferase [uncultured Alistipes sp.]|uniref:CatA-like O-acetyltransferase n=1 Tax=uncultured Alistipes sp. TaxID=538949 RepID=UPI0025DF8623|nr:CatA-like O-acetyltransferase [uncultured Alistipes sp.]